MNEIGHVLWHSLDEAGNIEVYDVKWPSAGVQTDIPANMLEGVKMSEHVDEDEQHGIQERDTPVEDRKYKPHKD